jgi:diadenosine tetraphosphate (Ap4A) HIT family hydrolase
LVCYYNTKNPNVKLFHKKSPYTKGYFLKIPREPFLELPQLSKLKPSFSKKAISSG